MSAPAVQVESLSKRYCRSLKRAALYGVVDAVRAAAGLPLGAPGLRAGEFWALQDLAFELAPGDSLGVIGCNGAGKSTLLKLLAGVIEPDRGRVRIRGRVGALIQLGAGFHPQLTGRENIFINGQLLGMRCAEVRAKLDRIVDFAEVGEFLDMPVKYYSSGMFVRLGFSIAAHLEPEVLLVDEALAVGDMAFQARSMALMADLCRRGTTLIFISHNEDLVRRACRRALLLDQGRCAAQGGMDCVYAEYHRRADWLPPARAGNGKAQITTVQTLDAQGRETPCVRLNEPLTLRVRVVPRQPIENPVLDVGFNHNHGYVAAAANSQDSGVSLGARHAPFWVELRMPEPRLAPGGYRLSVQVMAADRLEVYDWRRNHWPLQVESDRYVRGAVYLPVEWSAHNETKARRGRSCSGV
jgi:ABC-type polysaccharide/polyol phosphate transport system ATPase subunit